MKQTAPTDAVDLTTKFDLPFLSQSLRTLDIAALLDKWDKSEAFSGEKALRLSASLSLSKRVLRFSAGDIDMKDLLSILEFDGKRSVRSAGNSSGTDTTALSMFENFVDFNGEGLDVLLEDKEAMTALVQKVDELSDDFRRVQQARAVPPSDERPSGAGAGAGAGADAGADAGAGARARALAADTGLRARLSAEFVSEVDIQAKKATKRRRANLLPTATSKLTAFVQSRAHNPYASQQEKEALAAECEISTDQVSNWLTNYRKRRWKARPSASKGAIADDEEDASATDLEPSGCGADEQVLRASSVEIAAGL